MCVCVLLNGSVKIGRLKKVVLFVIMKRKREERKIGTLAIPRL